MSSHSVRPPHLVVGFDDSPESHSALRWAAQLARITGASIEVIDSWSTYGWIGLPPPPPRAALHRHIDAALAGVFGDQRPVDVTTSVMEGSAAAALVTASERATMVIVGSRGHGPATGWVIGSVSAQVAEYARCPVLVVHSDPPADGTLRRILVGVDGSSSSRAALQWAAALARTDGASVDALSAWHHPPVFAATALPPIGDTGAEAGRALAAVVEETFEEQRPAGLELHTMVGDAAHVLLDASEGADLVVVGSRGHGGFAGLLLGSVSARVAERADCAVLVIHGGAPPTWSVPSRDASQYATAEG